MKRSGVIVLALCLAFGSRARAQELRGTVRDSTSRIPVPGAVVLVLDSAGNTLSRHITGERGQYRVEYPSAARRVRLMRIGFAPATMDMRAPRDGVIQRDFVLAMMPTLLGQVRVTATPGCEPRDDRAAAFSLLEQARAGLLATVVARETQPASVIRLVYERTLEPTGEHIVRQTVRSEKASQATVSFNASHSAIDFVRRGFREDSAGLQTFYGPDADVLLDPGFTRGYCFHLMTPERGRPNQAGVGFTPANRRRGRVDITGALWVDTASRTLKDIVFRYRGLDQLSEGLGAGGTVHFHTMASGIGMIDRWSLRLIGSADTIVNNGQTQATVRSGYRIREIGGELARADWPDGSKYLAPLGTLELKATTHAGALAAGVMVGLDGTDYRGLTDSTGAASIPYLIPGPYDVRVIDPSLATLGITLPTPLHFVASRGATSQLRLDTPTAEDFVAAQCGDRDRDPNSAWVVGRVMTPDGKPVEGAQWKLRKLKGAEWTDVADNGVTGTNGLFHYCRNLDRGQSVDVQSFSAGRTSVTVRQPLRDRITALPVEMRPVVVARTRDAQSRDVQGVETAPSTIVLTGIVTDSASGLPVPDARVSLMGTLLEAASDASGRFLLGGIARGPYTIQVNTPSLDSLGAVKRVSANLSDATPLLQLVVPSASQVAASMCSDSGATGVLIGRVGIQGDSVLPDNILVVAEWRDSTARHVQWLRTRADAQGTYRMCGVPLNTALVLRTEVDSGYLATAIPVDTWVLEQQRYARADLVMDRAVRAGGVFFGTVTDSAGRPIVDAEVVMAGLNRSMLTNAQGGFRFTEIPEGVQSVLVRRIGYAALTANVPFAINQAVEHRIPLKQVTALKTVAVVENTTRSTTMEQQRKLGLGRVVTRDEIARNEGRSLGDILFAKSGVAVGHGVGGQGWIATRRPPSRLIPRAGDRSCGPQPTGSGPPGSPGNCSFDRESLRSQNYYCPSKGEEAQGLTCACYARVYLDDKLVNGGMPTEPFDINTIATNSVEAMEWYASAAQTPSKYSGLGSTCGVLAIWTRSSSQ